MIVKNNCKWLLQACPVEGGGEGGDGGRKVVNKKCNTTQKGIHSRPMFHNFYIPLPLQKLAKTLLTLPLDFKFFNPFASMGQKVFKYFIIEMLASANFHLNL
jgi:hypothetical protein